MQEKVLASSIEKYHLTNDVPSFVLSVLQCCCA